MTMLHRLPHGAYPSAGSVVWIRAYLVFKHKGLVTDRIVGGRPTVIANIPGVGVREQTWDEFADGQIPQLLLGFRYHLQWYVVKQRAYARMGTKYDLYTYNCDHFVNDAHGLPVISEQLEAMKALGLFVGVVALASAR